MPENPVGTKEQRARARKAWSPPPGAPNTREAMHFRNALDGLDIAEEMAKHVRHNGPCQIALDLNLETGVRRWQCTCGAKDALRRWQDWKQGR